MTWMVWVVEREKRAILVLGQWVGWSGVHCALGWRNGGLGTARETKIGKPAVVALLRFLL